MLLHRERRSKAADIPAYEPALLRRLQLAAIEREAQGAQAIADRLLACILSRTEVPQ